MKTFSEIKEQQPKKYENKETLKNKLYELLNDLNVKVAGEDSEKLHNVEIEIQGKEDLTEKLKELIDDIRIQERINTLNHVKANVHKNFNIQWFNEQLDNLQKIKVGEEFVLTEKLNDTTLGDNYRAALLTYIANKLDGETQLLDGWEFNFDKMSGVFEFVSETKNINLKGTPFWYDADKVSFEAYDLDDESEPIYKKELNFYVENILYDYYLNLLSQQLMIIDRFKYKH